jgi:hypothetical protein
VALYFENSLLPPDLALLPAASAAVTHIDRINTKTIVDAAGMVGLPWKGAASVDGHSWPATDGDTVWLPAGSHSVELARADGSVRLLRLNAELDTAGTLASRDLEFSYHSTARAIAVLDRAPRLIRIDGSLAKLEMAGPSTLLLPPGEHVVTITTE